MNKNVHFVNTVGKDNEEFRIYDIAFLSNNIVISSDIIGQLIYYEITENNIFFKYTISPWEEPRMISSLFKVSIEYIDTKLSKSSKE